MALLESLGAQAVVLPRGGSTEVVERCSLDGILFSGGGDVSASLYGGRVELSWDRIDAERDAGELALFRKGFAQRLPMLCVCRGMQIANIAFGGTLIEDIEREFGVNYRIQHHQVRELGKPPEERTHEVQIKKGSELSNIIGAKRFWTNSVHHQSIRVLAPPLRAVAHADDGVIEAVELAAPDFFFFGVQWHPESLPADEASTQLYSAFIEAAAQGRILDSGMPEP